jgi:nucleoside phosphorylase
MPCAVIITSLAVEYLAVCKHLKNLREVIHPRGTIYEMGHFSSWEVGIVEIGVGNLGAELETEWAIAYFAPEVVLFVGVAGGLKDVSIGDVVVARDVYGYESGTFGSASFLARPALGQSNFALVQRARAEARKEDWLKRGEVVGVGGNQWWLWGQ